MWVTDLHLLEVKLRVMLTNNPKVWCLYIKYSSRYKAKLLGLKCRSLWTTFTLRSNFGSYCLTIYLYDVLTSNTLPDIRQNYRTYYYFEVRLWVILNHIPKVWCLLFIHQLALRYTQTHWTMKFMSLWPIFILCSIFRSYWLIIRKYGVYTWNTLQDIRQNHWTVKTLQDTRQNYWPVKYR